MTAHNTRPRLIEAWLADRREQWPRPDQPIPAGSFRLPPVGKTSCRFPARVRVLNCTVLPVVSARAAAYEALGHRRLPVGSFF